MIAVHERSPWRDHFLEENNADRVTVFRREYSHLLAVAFRILGSDADAQDVVQEAWIRYARADIQDVRNESAWLTTVVTRLCLDVLRRSREYPLEPVYLPAASAIISENPEEIALLAGELTEAFTNLLDELTPPQRVALILHDVFGTPFEEVVHVLGTTPGSAMKLASRARGRIRRPTSAGSVDPGAAREVVSASLRAAQQGDIDGLVGLLHPNVTRTADPQTVPPDTALKVRGVQAVVTETQSFRDHARRARMVEIDGQPGIAVMSGQLPLTALVFHIAGDRIVHYDVIADPRRLALLDVQH